MTILFLWSALNHCCGVSRHLLLLGKGLRERGHRVLVLSAGGSAVPDLVAAGLEHLVAPIDPARKTVRDALRVSAAVVRIVRRERVDVIHAHHRYPELLAHLVAPLTRASTVMTCHNILRDKRLLSYRSDAVIAVSAAVQRNLVSDYAMPARKIHVVSNAPAAIAAPSSAEVERFRLRLGIPRGKLVVAGVGRLSREKGFDLLVDALRSVVAAAPSVHCLIAGDGPERAALEAEARRHDLPVTFAGEVSEVGLVYASSDIVVVPSRIESSGLVPMEAAEFGRAVVAAAVGGLPELITAERGVLIPSESAAALAATLVELIADPQRRARLGAALRDHVARHRGVPAFIDGVEAVYRHVLGARAHSRQRPPFARGA
jgi:glycosyltransferase involved in cell wall biosynthesis